MPPRQFLRDFLPRAGLRFPENGLVLLSSEQREEKVIKAFKNAGLVPPGRHQDKQTKKLVRNALAEMMSLASTEELLALLPESLDLIGKLKKQVPWAAALTDSVFFEFFGLLVKAREEWHKRPLPPFNTADHCQLAKEIDSFKEKSGRLFAEAELVLYQVVGGFEDGDGDDDDSNDGDVEMGGMGEEEEAEVEQAREMLEEMELDG